MARVPDALIAALKAGMSVQSLAEASGVVFRRQGADLVGRCPFHEDHTPSLVLTPAKNLWHCFGACQAGGTVIDWVMHSHGVSFRQAVELLQKQAPLPTPRLPPIAASVVNEGSRVTPLTREDAQLLGQVIEHYHQVLLQNQQARDYLKHRGIGNEEAVRTFKLGFANGTLPATTGEHTRQRLQRLGVLRRSGREHFCGSIVIPVINASAEVTEVYGRKINDDNLPPGTPVHLYLPGPHRGVWNAATLCGAAGEPSASVVSEVVLCEALIDALTFWCAGHHNVTASYGSTGFTADHRSLFKQYGIQRVLLAYDRDDAGDRAAQRLAQQLTAEGIDCYRVLFPNGMDANQYALEAGPQSLGVALRSAQLMISTTAQNSTKR
jgi:DNA primase